MTIAAADDVFRQIRDDIRHRVEGLFRLGFLESIRQLRLTLGSLLDNLTDGVLAHDLERRIYFFNPAAQKITGYEFRDVVGRDCHDVFADRFCGGDCSFCDDQLRHGAAARAVSADVTSPRPDSAAISRCRSSPPTRRGWARRGRW